MLEMMRFNKKIYRYRVEDPDTILLYQLRTGDLFFLSGRAKELIGQFDQAEKVPFDTEDKIVRYLRLIEAIVPPAPEAEAEG